MSLPCTVMPMRKRHDSRESLTDPIPAYLFPKKHRESMAEALFKQKLEKVFLRYRISLEAPNREELLIRKLLPQVHPGFKVQNERPRGPGRSNKEEQHDKLLEAFDLHEAVLNSAPRAKSLPRRTDEETATVLRKKHPELCKGLTSVKTLLNAVRNARKRRALLRMSPRISSLVRTLLFCIDSQSHPTKYDWRGFKIHEHIVTAAKEAGLIKASRHGVLTLTDDGCAMLHGEIMTAAETAVSSKQD
jgi:hypothetical protein